jgi:hypothetical protein
MKRLKIIVLITICFLFTASFKIVQAQCCAAGNPVGGDLLLGSIGKNNLKLILQYKHSYSDQYFHEGHAENVPQINFSRFNYSSFQFIYGIGKRFNVFGEIGYFIDKSQSVSVQGNHLFSATGIGDLGLNAKYVIYSSTERSKELNLSAGIKLPVGAFDQMDGNVILPLSLQPSTGATKYTTTIHYFYRPLDSKFGLFLNSSADMHSTISSKNYYYRYGNVYINSVSGTYKINNKLGVVVQARMEHREKDEREQGIIVASTGSDVVFLSPSIQYLLPYKLEAGLQVDYPIYKHVNGYQLTNKFSFSFNLARKLSFNKTPKEKQL